MRTKAIIRWEVGQTVINDSELGDPRIAAELDRLAALEYQLGRPLWPSVSFVEQPSSEDTNA